jgi:hypothetical protein
MVGSPLDVSKCSPSTHEEWVHRTRHGVSLGALWASRPGVSFRTSRTCRTSWPSRTLWASRARVSLVAFRSLWPCRTSRARVAFDPGGGQARWPALPLVPFRSL